MKSFYPANGLTGVCPVINRYFTFLTFALLLFSSPVAAVDYYWVGGSGMWSDHNTHWATASGGLVFHDQVPTSMDDVHFDENSFPSGGTVTVDETIVYCRSMDWTGATNTPEFSGSNNIYIHGSLILISDMTLSFSGQIHFLSELMLNTVTSAGQVFIGNVYFEGAGGEWTFSDDFTSDGDIRQSAGTLHTDNHTLMVDDIIAGGSSIYLGSSDVHVAVNFSVGSGTILDAGTSHLYVGSGDLSASVSHTFYNVTKLSNGQVSSCNIDQKLTF
ncbi:MAG: hypothetical protein KDC61_10760, partial [Saprospiraceae bacterium]|nr:hypothetical protein [Saprospiraceae bacterium]